MGEWWNARLGDLATYRPSDFLMFAPRTYWRLFELHNAHWWPLPLVWPMIGLAACAWLWRGGVVAQRVVAAGLSAVCLFVAQAFVLERYEPINWAASGLVWLFWALAAVLLGLACARHLGPAAAPSRRLAALALAAWALAGHPWLAWAWGRPLAQAEIFGLAPDPTAMAVLAWLLQGSVVGGGSLARWAWRAAWALALALCAISVATLATMEEAQAVVVTFASGAALVLAGWFRRKPRSPRARVRGR